MEWIKFNDDETMKGIEGKWCIEYDTLIVFLQPTSGFIDWIIDFIALPIPVELVNPRLGWCHAGFKSYAYWLTGFIYSLTAEHTQVNKVILTGYSMGGGIAQLAAVICSAWMDRISFNVVSIDGPRTTTKLPEGILYYNKGSLVYSIPPWFKKLSRRRCLNTKWRPVWISHADYNIEKILVEK